MVNIKEHRLEAENMAKRSKPLSKIFSISVMISYKLA
tara:strand:- start:250 stop:360 length:111 start_codon:yes stop_codon:yes gene_type:complete